MDKKLIIKKMENNSYTSAVKELAHLEIIANKANTKLESIIVDSRDPESIITAADRFGVVLPDSGIYIVAEAEDFGALSRTLVAEVTKNMENNSKNTAKKSRSTEVI